jgi:small nuclear ribonucleoprotein
MGNMTPPITYLVKHLGKKVSVSLKNGMTLKGVLKSVDLALNLELNEVIELDQEKNEIEKAETVLLRGDKIEYIQIIEE